MTITIRRLSQPPALAWAVSCTEMPEAIVHAQMSEQQWRQVAHDPCEIQRAVAAVLHDAQARLAAFRAQLEGL